jgi:hypothetical protein
MEYIRFLPMSEFPQPDESDESFSVTVLVYSEGFRNIELGYYDFETNRWSHFGDNSFLLKCWCYIPLPEVNINENEWEAVMPKGYNKHYLGS